jgi:hypothetical protein
MAYNLQRTTQAFKSGKNILASEHVQFIEAGATLKAGTNFAIGTLIARDKTTGKFETFANANVANYDDFGILNVDADATSFDAIVGEVIVKGSVYEAKLPANADLTAFKAKVPSIRFVKHV